MEAAPETWYARSTDSGLFNCSAINGLFSLTAGSSATSIAMSATTNISCWYTDVRSVTLEAGDWSALVDLTTTGTGQGSPATITIAIVSSSGTLVETLVSCNTGNNPGGEQTCSESIGQKTLTNQRIRLTVNKASGNRTIHAHYNGAAGGSADTRLTIPGELAATTTLDVSSDPGDATVAPGSGIREAGSFSFNTNSGTDSITSLNVALANLGSPYLGLAQAEIRATSCSGTPYFNAITSFSNNNLTFSGGTPITATTTQTTFKICLTPLSHANMPGPPGANYLLSPYVTDWTGSNTKSGFDINLFTLTIDNTSPNGATSTSGSSGNQIVNLNWNVSSSSDVSQSVVLRWTGSSPGSEVPVEGASYSVGDTISTASVACFRTGDSASASVSGVDGAGTGGCSATPLSNGQEYSYKIFQKDSRGNYDSGVIVSGSPFTPFAGTLSVNIVDAGGIEVESPTMDMDSALFSLVHQSVEGIFGISSQRIRVSNTTGNPQWSLSIAPTGGTSAVWSTGTEEYDFNDPSSDATDGGDTDSVGGQLSVSFSDSTITPEGGCTATGLTLGSNASFSEGVVDSITLLSGGASAEIGCYWDLLGMKILQTIPIEQPAGSYTLNMTLTITAI